MLVALICGSSTSKSGHHWRTTAFDGEVAYTSEGIDHDGLDAGFARPALGVGLLQKGEGGGDGRYDPYPPPRDSGFRYGDGVVPAPEECFTLDEAREKGRRECGGRKDGLVE